MKIAFLHHSFQIGSGIDSLIYQYAKRLGKTDEVSVITFYSEYASCPEFRVKVFPVPSKQVRSMLPIIAPQWQQARTEANKADVTISMLAPASLIPTKKTFNVVVDWSVPSPDSVRSPLEQGYLKWLKAENGRADKKADLLITPSQFCHDYVKREYGLESKLMWLDGIDFELFDRSKYEKDRGLIIPNGITYVGRIAPHKNIEALLKAFSLVLKEFTDATLFLIGAKTFPSYYKMLSKLGKELVVSDCIYFCDSVPWSLLPEEIFASDVYVSASRHEGFMRVECYAMGKPAVVFDNSANRETVIDGVTGIVVKEETPEAFAQAIIYLLKNPDKAREMGENGYRFAREKLDLDVMARDLRGLIWDSLKH